jgi:hypothetical protein
MRILFATTLVVVGLTAGCDAILGSALNPKYCKAHPQDSDCEKAYPDAAVGPMTCMNDQQCSGDPNTPVCDLGAGGTNTCVMCTATDHALCMGTMPACIDNTCQKCTMHAQCDSAVCLPDGSCADSTMVAYVQEGGTGSPPCTKDLPCGTLDNGLKSNKPTVKMSGTVADNMMTVVNGQAVTIVSDPGAKLSRSNPGIILQVENDGAVVKIYNLEITLGTGLGNPAISIPVGGSPQLILQQVTVDLNQGVGINVSAGTLTISRSTVSGNSGGGISINGSQYDITNSFITGNGGTMTGLGGMEFSNIAIAAGNRFEFNTITANNAAANIDSGIVCNSIVVPLSFSDNIIYGNFTSGAAQQFGGTNCSATYSDIGPMAFTGTGNINQDPEFTNPASGDYHIQPGSPAENAADPAATLSVDFDGDTRPQGGRSDMGADEVKQ